MPKPKKIPVFDQSKIKGIIKTDKNGKPVSIEFDELGLMVNLKNSKVLDQYNLKGHPVELLQIPTNMTAPQKILVYFWPNSLFFRLPALGIAGILRDESEIGKAWFYRPIPKILRY